MSDNISRFIQAVGTFLIGIALLIGVAVGSSTLQTGGQGRTLSVTGKAIKELAPNQSVVSGTFEEQAKNSDEARKKTREKAGKGLEALKAKGIAEKKITTTQVAVYPEYDYSITSSGKPKITGYKGTTSLEIKLDDVKKADEIIAVMTGSGASSTSGPALGFTTATRDRLEKELKLQAITDAKAQAEALAKQSGAKLGKVLSINQGGLIGGPEPVPYRGLAMEDKAISSVASPTDISIGEKEVVVTVTVTYQLK